MNGKIMLSKLLDYGNMICLYLLFVRLFDILSTHQIYSDVREMSLHCTVSLCDLHHFMNNLPLLTNITHCLYFFASHTERSTDSEVSDFERVSTWGRALAKRKGERQCLLCCGCSIALYCFMSNI